MRTVLRRQKWIFCAGAGLVLVLILELRLCSLGFQACALSSSAGLYRCSLSAWLAGSALFMRFLPYRPVVNYVSIDVKAVMEYHSKQASLVRGT